MPKTDKPNPKFAPAPPEMIHLFENALGVVPEAEVRKMFGYPAGFVNGNMFTGLHGNDMVVRLSPDDLGTFLALEGSRQFEPMPGRPMREYAVVPPSLLKSGSELGTWLRKAYAYAKSIPPKPAKKKKKG